MLSETKTKLKTPPPPPAGVPRWMLSGDGGGALSHGTWNLDVLGEEGNPIGVPGKASKCLQIQQVSKGSP